MNGKKFIWKFKNLGVLGLVVIGIVLMLSGSVDAYSGSGTCYCSDCHGCYNALNNNACTIVNLNTDIANNNGTCINDPENFTNKIFDCQGHTIEGNKTKNSYGILLSKKSNNTIKNCIIKNFDYGIYIYSSSENKIINNTLNLNNYGIYLSSLKSLSCSNANNCIHSSSGDYVYSEIEKRFILISDDEASLNNEISNNSVCGNEISDISLNNEGENFGNNICDKISNNTNTMVFCSKSCSSSEKQKTLFLYYCDYDKDSYFSMSVSGYCFGYTDSCVPMGCSVNKGNDCNDSNSTIHPNANEITCNGIDEDCNEFDKCGKRIWSSDKHNNEKNTYYSYQDVYASGTGFNPNSEIDVYILPYGSVNLTSDYIVKKRITTNENGNFVALLWTLPLWSKLSTFYYEIIVDENLNGIYDSNETISAMPFEFSVDPIWASDKGGAPKSEFKKGENVYINGNGLSVTNINLYIIPNIKVSEGQSICSNEGCLNVSKSVEAEVDEKGTFKSVVFYSKDLQPGEYKVLPDLDRDGIIDAEDMLAMDDLNYVGFVITNDQASTIKKANGEACSSNDECESGYCFFMPRKTVNTKIWRTCQNILAINGRGCSVSFKADTTTSKYILTETFISRNGKVYITNYTLTNVTSNAVNTETFNYLAKGTHCFTLKRCDASDNCNAEESLGCASINFGCGAAKIGEPYLVSWKKGNATIEYGSLTGYKVIEWTLSSVGNSNIGATPSYYKYDENTTYSIYKKDNEGIEIYTVRSCYNNFIYLAAQEIEPNGGCVQIFKDEVISEDYNITCYADLDNDGYTNNTNIVYSDTGICPAHYKNSTTTQDCNDNDSAINPGENETTYGIDGKDNNCNGIVDDCFPANSSINTQIYCSASGQMAYKKGFNATCSGNYECLSSNCPNGHCAGYLSHENVNKSGFGNVSNYMASNNIASNSRVKEIPIEYVTTTHQILTTIPDIITPGTHCFEIECTTNKYQNGKLIARDRENVLGIANIILTLPDGNSVNIYTNANGEICYDFGCGIYKITIPKGVCGEEYSKTITTTYGKLHITPSDLTKAKVNEDLTYIIKDDSRNIVKDAKVSIVLPDKNLARTSDFEGKITFNVGEKEGGYTLNVQKDCYENDTLIGTILMPKLTLKCDPQDVMAGGTLCCYVTDNGKSVEGATVKLAMPDGKEIQLISDVNGEVCIKTQIPGNINATASKEGYKDSDIAIIKITECNVSGVPCWVFALLFVITIFIIWIKSSASILKFFLKNFIAM